MSVNWHQAHERWHGMDDLFSLKSSIVIISFHEMLSLSLMEQELIDQELHVIIKIWADKLGIGMRLNQNIMLRFVSVPTSDAYRVISSEDGIHWIDVEIPGKEYTRDQSGSISVSTSHLSYFALLSNTVTLPPPSCTLSATPTTLYNGSSTILSWNIMNIGTGILTPGNTILAWSGSINIVPPSDSTTNYTLSVVNTSGNAACSTQVTTSPIPSSPIVGGSSWPGGPGSPVPSLDVCPDGDLSGSQYDGTCEPWLITTSGSMNYKKEVQVTEKVKEKKKITSPLFGEKEIVWGPVEQTYSLPKYLYVAAEHTLTFRTKPFVSAWTILGYLSRNTQVEVLEEWSEWMRVIIDWVEWFVKSSYLRNETTADKIRRWIVEIRDVPYWIIHVDHSWFIRKKPLLSARIIAVVHSDDTVMILDELPQLVWNQTLRWFTWVYRKKSHQNKYGNEYEEKSIEIIKNKLYLRK
jgi:hypothetical protein